MATISAPGRHLSLPKSVAAVGVEAWNRKAGERVDDARAKVHKHVKQCAWM